MAASIFSSDAAVAAAVVKEPRAPVGAQGGADDALHFACGMRYLTPPWIMTGSSRVVGGAATEDTMPDDEAPLPVETRLGAAPATWPWALGSAAASNTDRPRGAPIPMRREPKDFTMM